MNRKPKLYGIHCVLVGNFNPTTFHPAWLKSYNLISEQAAENANIQIIHPKLAVFQIENLTFHIEDGRFIASTTDEASFEILRDLVTGIFTLLETTPITQLGLNSLAHFQMDSEAKWHEFGNTVVPKSLWKDILENPGTKSVLIQGTNKHAAAGFVQIKAEPSVRVANGVFIELNNHHDFKDSIDAKLAVEVIKTKWDIIVGESFVAISKLAEVVK